MNIEPLCILVVISRPLAQLVLPVEHGGQQFVAVSPVSPAPAVDGGKRMRRRRTVM